MKEAPAPDPSIGHEDEVFGGINMLTKSLDHLDERGLVLSLAAFAEDALGHLLKSFLIPSEATSQLLEGFNAPLGTFSSRTKAAFAMGLVTTEQYQDLERLRKIRNEFAHAWRSVDLSKQNLASLVDAMNYSRIGDRFPESLAEKVQSAMTSLLAELRSSAQQISVQRSQARTIGNHLIRGFRGEGFDLQLQEAQRELEEIQTQLQGALGERLKFCRELIARLDERIALLARPSTQEQKSKLLAFSETLQHVLRSAVAS